MADEYSFDIVSKVDLQSVDDAVNTCNREISVRFDFRGSISRVDFDRPKGEITLQSDNEGKAQSVIEILKLKVAKRQLDLKILDFQKIESALGGKVKQLIKIKQGITPEIAKKIVADIKSSKAKVTPSIQKEQVRVTSKSKDALQGVVSQLKSIDYGVPLQFVNYR